MWLQQVQGKRGSLHSREGIHAYFVRGRQRKSRVSGVSVEMVKPVSLPLPKHDGNIDWRVSPGASQAKDEKLGVSCPLRTIDSVPV